MKENEFQNNIIELAQLKGFTVAHFRTVRVQRKDGSVYYCTPVQSQAKGFPDLVLLKEGRMIVAELKSDKGKTSPEQDKWLDLFCTVSETYVWRPKQWDNIVEVLCK